MLKGVLGYRLMVLIVGTGISMSGDTVTCQATNLARDGSYKVSQLTPDTLTRWCCCGGCCGYSRDCRAIPGCTSC